MVNILLQVVLKASSGMDYQEFLQFLCVVAASRLTELHIVCGCVETNLALSFSRLSQQLSIVLTKRKLSFKCTHDGSLIEVSADSPNTAKSVKEQCTPRAWFECLKPRDNLMAYLQRGTAQKPANDGTCDTVSSSQPLMFSSLFADLSVEIQAAVKSSIAEHHSWQFALAVFRSFELCSIVSILEELLQQPGLM